MKFYLANNVPCKIVEECFTSTTSKTAQADISGYPTPTSGSDATLFSKFKTAFDREMGNSPRKLMIEFNPIEEDVQENGEPKTASNLWSITLKSDVLKAVHNVLHYGNDSIPLKIEVQLGGQWYSSYNGHSATAGPIKVQGFAPRKEANSLFLHDCYEDLVKLPPPPQGNHAYYSTRNWTLTIQVHGSDFISLEGVLPNCSEAYRKIYNSKDFFDYEIISGDGTVIPCHKILLCANSSTFSNMLKGKYEEAKSNKMTISDMSTRGINAMLAFLYWHDVREALAYCDVALELLKAADVYDISVLWKVVAYILSEKSPAWYDIDVAVKLAAFVANCEQKGSDKLAKKMIEVLTAKSEQLLDSKAYQELFPTPATRTLFKLSLEMRT